MKIYIRSNVGDAPQSGTVYGIHNEPSYIRDIQKLFQIGEDLSGLSTAIKTIRSTPNHEDLPSKYRAHPYKYSYHGVEYGIVVDVHIKGDLILLYQIKNGIMNCIRIGTHRDLKIGSNTEVSSTLVYI